MIDSCYRLREKADYDDFFLAAKEDAEHQLEKAKHVIHAVEQFIAEKRRMRALILFTHLSREQTKPCCIFTTA